MAFPLADDTEESNVASPLADGTAPFRRGTPEAEVEAKVEVWILNTRADDETPGGQCHAAKASPERRCCHSQAKTPRLPHHAKLYESGLYIVNPSCPKATFRSSSNSSFEA